jgi:flagellar biosynthesis chaperone FliJ
MKNVQQITLIHDALIKQRDNIALEISSINKVITTKRESIKKMIQYLDEYYDDNKYSLSKCVPILNKNFDIFKDKINRIIFKEEKEIDHLIETIHHRMHDISLVDKKIELMGKFKNRAEDEIDYELEQSEQRAQDDMSSTRYIRKNHD